MLVRLVIASLLSAGAQALAPAPVRWGGPVGKHLSLTPRASSHTGTRLPQELTSSGSTSEQSVNMISYFAAHSDNTIIEEATGGCLEATGDRAGDAVLVNQCTGAASQKWDWLPSGPLQLRGTNQCVDVAEKRGVLDGASIRLRECENSMAWKFEDPGSFLSPESSHHLAMAASIQHVMLSLAGVAVLGAVSASAWWWRWSKRSHEMALFQCDVHESMDHGGVSLPEKSGRPEIPAVLAFSPIPVQDWKPRVHGRSLNSQRMAERCNSIIMDTERLEPLTLEDLTVTGLDALTIPTAARLLHKHGVVVVRKAAPLALVEKCHGVVEQNLAACRDALGRRGIGMDDPFQHTEIVHRAKRRYDMQLGEEAHEPLAADVLADASWQPLMRNLLGNDATCIFTGTVVSEPGAEAQPQHMDGGHLFHSTHGFEQPQCPPHCINVFLPLVDVTADIGPTEFWPGSHMLGRARDAYDSGEPGIALAGARGDIIVFDYRVVHRGLANTGDARRPVLYSTFARPWFRDAHNFPPNPLFGAASGSGFGGGSAKLKGKAKGKAQKRKR